MVTKNTYYVVKLGSFESVFSTSDFVGYNMFWDAFSDSWMLADREIDYVDTLAILCPNANATDALAKDDPDLFDQFCTDALADIKKDSCLFYALCVAAERVYRENCDRSVDSYIDGPFTADDLADQLRRGKHGRAAERRESLSRELASMWSDGDLPDELESELEARGIYLTEDGDSLVTK